MKVAVVLTTINLEAPAIPVLANKCQELGWDFIIVGDKKTKGTPPKYCIYLDVEQQLSLGYKLTEMLPWNDYVRKNIGYICAYHLGAEYIISTDDDNIPLDNWESMPSYVVKNAQRYQTYPSCGQFLNFMNRFTDEYTRGMWPRGLPFGSVRIESSTSMYNAPKTTIGIVAGLWDGSPDLDSIGHQIWYRDNYEFKRNQYVVPATGVLAPYNTQNTLITRELLPYQFLAHGIGRANDIWASYISQFVMKQLDHQVMFISPTVYQQRNKHNFHQDFQDEIICYTKTVDFVQALRTVAPNENPIKYYTDLCAVADSYISGDGTFLNEVKTWLSDLGVVHE